MFWAPFLFFSVLCNGLVIPQMNSNARGPFNLFGASDSNSNTTIPFQQNGFVSFLQPAFLVEQDLISILSLARFKNSSMHEPQRFTIVGKINATAAKLRSKHSDLSHQLRPTLLDVDRKFREDTEFVKVVSRKFLEFLDTSMGGSDVPLQQRLSCERDAREPSLLFCFDFGESKKEKREEPVVTAQMLSQLFRKVKSATERVSDNVDFLADDPKEFFINLDEKFDDKLLELADKWDEASEQLSSVSLMNEGEVHSEAVDEDEEEDPVESGYNGFHGFNVD
ncbi:hypothetical protein FT663_02736 [Candidozyma haemuli var. vulneris]|nr:hypothetical protein FT662_02721 [[Candida] haemuloni var. vulneris]KAF3991438.1 hypothetical protein FT663_02736 [[Candida] haemuloni var. vulneris]